MPIDGPLMAIGGPHEIAMAIDELRSQYGCAFKFHVLTKPQLKPSVCLIPRFPVSKWIVLEITLMNFCVSVRHSDFAT